jgi:hypothetical protein
MLQSLKAYIVDGKEIRLNTGGEVILNASLLTSQEMRHF